MSKYAIYIFFDDNYLNLANITLLSFLSNYHQFKFDVYYVKNSLCKLSDKSLCSFINHIEKYTTNVEQILNLCIPYERLNFYINDSKKWGKKTKGVPISILTYEIFSHQFEKYEKLFYLDADLQFIKPNKDLFLNNTYDILVYPDIGVNYKKLKRKGVRKYLKIHDYSDKMDFNAGFIILNCKKIWGKNNDNLINELLRFHKDHIHSVEKLYEQKVLNMFFFKKLCEKLTIKLGTMHDCFLKSVYKVDPNYGKLDDVRMIHYTGIKPYFQNEPLGKKFWNTFSNMSFDIIKKITNKKIHIFCRDIPDEILINENDVVILMNHNINERHKLKGNTTFWFNGLTSDITNIITTGIDVYCVPNIYNKPHEFKIIQNESYLYINYFDLLARKYPDLSSYYTRKEKNLPTTGVSAVLFSLLLTDRNNIKIYDMTLYNHGKGYKFPHTYELDSSILKSIGYSYSTQTWTEK